MSEERMRMYNQALDCGVPRHTIEPLLKYIFDRIEPGSFLRAFLENDLMEALGRADDINVRHFREIATFLYSYVPGICKGSRERVDRWLSMVEAVN